MSKKKLADICYKIFGWGVLITLMLGGLSFFGFFTALIIGGETATTIAVFIQKKYFPIVIQATTFFVFAGLIGMYLNNVLALSIIADKKEMDEELNKFKGKK